ncbi:MAG: Bax inhibitor-1/YccA family protein [Bifidobacteriaceae bacterium]|nr:Bax inhibitor-1/YccA family protein [Bifidobacteriaceae bacterium]
MSNPVFGRTAAFSTKGGVTYPESQSGNQVGLYPSAQGAYTGAVPPSAEQLSQMYQAPAAGPLQTGRLTYEDVLVKTVGMLALTIVAGAATWALMPGLWMVGMGVGFVLGLVNVFKKQPSPALICLYAVAEGVFLGGISRYYESVWNGIVLQAVIGTLGVFLVMLLLFRSGKVRATGRAAKIMLVAMAGYMVFSLVNAGLVRGGVIDDWGAYSASYKGFPIGIIISIVAILLASYSFVLDFDSIKTGVERGAPAKMAWTAAFGLLMTLVWLYLEILRMLAILRDS